MQGDSDTRALDNLTEPCTAALDRDIPSASENSRQEKLNSIKKIENKCQNYIWGASDQKGTMQDYHNTK